MSEDNSAIESSGGEVDLKKYGGPEGCLKRWRKELDLVKDSKGQRNFEANGERIVKIYTNQSQLESLANQSINTSARVMYNVLWSNVQVLQPCLYARQPQVVVERRFKDSDPIGRLASDIAERATQFMLSTQQDTYNYSMSQAVLDRLLPGRGLVRVRYGLDWDEAKDENGEPIVQNGQAVRTPKPYSEYVKTEYIHWEDYLESPARTPLEIRWRAVRSYMNRDQLVTRFGEQIGKEVKLTHTGEGKRNRSNDGERAFLMQAEVWEIWDKISKRVYWISDGYDKAPLDVKDDPLHLDGFFPFPDVLLATTTSASSYPTPDYIIYQRLAEQYDYVCKRLAAMVDCVRLVGACNAAVNADVKNMLKLQDGQLWPIANWPAHVAGEGFEGQIDWLPFDKCAAAIPILSTHLIELKAQIDEITSMPDIVQGSSDPNDPVYSQQQKSHWTVIKLVKKQQDVQRFNRQVVMMTAEIIFEPGLFSDDTIALMAGLQQMDAEKQQMFPDALALLRNDRLRTFRVDIETDSTIASDDEQTIARWQQYMEAVKNVVGEVQGISEYRPELLHPIIESAKAAVRALRTGRTVEGAWDSAWDQIETAQKEALANPQPPPPDPQMLMVQVEQQKIQQQGMKDQAENALKQQQQQAEQWAAGMKIQLDQQQQQIDLMLKGKELDIKAQGVMSKAQIDELDQQLKTFETQFNASIESKRLELEKYTAVLDEKEKFAEEARLAAEQHMEVTKIVNEHAVIDKEHQNAMALEEATHRNQMALARKKDLSSNKKKE